MGYDIIWFRTDEQTRYESFLRGLGRGAPDPEKYIGRDWWDPVRPTGGFLLFAYTPEEIASRCVLTARKLVWDGQVVDCFEIGGTHTQPQHQRRGLFSRLVKKAMELGFDTPAQVIYGTPNDRSGPGYRKLGYSFIDQPDSRLVLLTRSIHPLLRKLGWKHAPVAPARQHDSQQKPPGGRIQEVGLDEYVRMTRDFPRMNWGGDDYLQRRLGGSAAATTRRFFHVSTAAGPWWCALRPYDLSFLRVVLVSEYFLQGQIDHGPAKFRSLRKIAAACYRGHDGIYLKCHVPPGTSPLTRMLRHRLVAHRELPICYISNPRYPSGSIDRLMSDLTARFQMTDCDIG
jgi:GNAT superfamily N-acetyltransferase